MMNFNVDTHGKLEAKHPQVPLFSFPTDYIKNHLYNHCTSHVCLLLSDHSVEQLYLRESWDVVCSLKDYHLRQHEGAHHGVTPDHLPRTIFPSSASPLPAKKEGLQPRRRPPEQTRFLSNDVDDLRIKDKDHRTLCSSPHDRSSFGLTLPGFR
jgi:hypothetical protein